MIVIFSDHIAMFLYWDKDQDIGTKHNNLISNLCLNIIPDHFYGLRSALELM